MTHQESFVSALTAGSLYLWIAVLAVMVLIVMRYRQIHNKQSATLVDGRARGELLSDSSVVKPVAIDLPNGDKYQIHVDGTETLEFSNGNLYTSKADLTEIREYANGDRFTWTADGTEIEEYTSGEKITRRPDGTTLIEYCPRPLPAVPLFNLRLFRHHHRVRA